ncbi:WD40 repeat domain-containing protein [Streptomyces roseifaciens]|uniref:WD40 repeat domain-containing protein n=1 Tax=Streptomyces roseifaciens TaxID=1488406 RepID=UPI000AE003D8|nr:WD40 repeat domain-containing protein [Streptomyces roseifaciens]
MRRQALVVGIEGADGRLADEAPPQWQKLEYAAPYARRLREVLGKQYAYVVLDPEPDPASTTAALSEALTTAVTGDSDYTIIHLLAHGRRTRNSQGLQVVGGDGQFTEALSRWINLVEDREADGEGPSVLLILDLCYSGAATTEHLRSLIRPERRRVWVLAACHPDRPAYDGRLSLAVDEVLRGFASGSLKLDESLEYIPIDRFCREVARSVEEQSAGSYPQSVERPLAALGDDLSHLRFFVNPRHAPDDLRSRGIVDPAVFTLLDEAADFRHFVIRAHGAHNAYGDGSRPTFTGRSDELRELSAWMAGHGSSLRVITGTPGSGKSALVGVLVCAAHPALREATEQVWRPSAGDMPDAVDGLAVVHARRRTISEVLSSLAAQWSLGSPHSGETWTTDRLVASLRTKAEPPHLIVDAVDEAEHPADLVTALLLPLASTRRADAKPLCRVLMATRPQEELQHLFEASEAHGGLINLDRIPAERLRRDLVNFVSRVLRPMGSGTSPWCSLKAAESLGRAMADTLLSGTREWGEFLVAGLYIRHLQEQAAPPLTTAEAEALGSGVPRALDAVLDLNLEFIAQPGLLELLTALAWAEGAGMPERLLAHVGDLPTAEAGEGQPNVSDLLRTARFYLRRNVDRDGTPLYRLFHQGLADQLRRRPILNAATVWDRLLATVRTRSGGPSRWATADPYLLRHAARHSSLAGKLGELLMDAEYLVHADPAPLAEELYHGERTSHGAVYLTSYGAHHSGPPDQRRNILAIDAARHQQWELATELSEEALWKVRWTAGRDLHIGLLTTLTGHQRAIRGLTALMIRGRPHALTASQDGTVRLWDLDSAVTTHELGGHGSEVNCVVAEEADGIFLAVTGCNRGVLRGWDLTTGHLLWTRQAHQCPVRSMVIVQYEGVRSVASVGKDRLIRYWDITTGKPLSTTQLSPVHGPVLQLSHVTVAGLGECVVASHDDWVTVLTVQGEEVDEEDLPIAPQLRMTCLRYLDLGHGPESVAGDDDGTVWIGEEVADEGHAAPVTDLAAVSMADSAYVVSASEDGTARLVNTTTWRVRQVASHTTAINRIAVVQDPDRTRLLTASEGGTVRIWDVDASTVRQRYPGHTHAINALVTLPGARLVSCSADGTLALWNTETGDRQQIWLTYEGDYPVPEEPTSIAVLEAGDHPRIVASCAIMGFALWDTSITQEYLRDRADSSPDSSQAILKVVIAGVTHIACAWGNGDIKLYSADRVDFLARWPHHDSAELANPPEEERVLLTVARGGTCLSASTTHLVAGDHTGSVWSARLQGSPMRRELSRHPSPVHAVATVELDGRPHVVSGDETGGLRVTSVEADARLDLTGHTRAVFAITPVLIDGRPHALTGGLDRSIRLWDLKTGRLLDVFWFPDTVFTIAAAQDGTVFAGVGPDIIRLQLNTQHAPLHPYTTPDQGIVIG